MKAIRLRDARCKNPEFSRAANRRRLAEGLSPIPATLQCRKGEIVEHPESPLLCVGEDPPLAPYDDECRKAVLVLLNQPSRKLELASLKRMYGMRDQLTKEAKAYVETLFGHHESEIVDSNAGKSQTAKTTPKADSSSTEKEATSSAGLK